MALTLITGPANAGKASLVLTRTRAEAERGEPILVVPTRVDAEAYRRELAAAGVVFGVRVERFAGLVAEIAARAGVAGRPLGEPVRERVVAAAAAGSTLRVCGPAAATPGFPRAFAGLVRELGQRRVSPARLRSGLRAWTSQVATRDRADYAEDIATMYSRYDALLARLGRTDRERHATAAIDALARDPACWGATPILFYGFDDLTPIELDAIETLARVVDAPVTLSLAYEPGRLAFTGRATTFQALAPLAVERVALAPRAEHYAPGAREALHHLERSLFEEDAPRVPAGGAVRLLEGGGERAELQLVAAEIRGLLDAGVPPGEIAVVRRASGRQTSVLDEVFAAAAIPYTQRQRLRFADTGVGRGFCALLRCAADDGDGAALLGWLRVSGRPGEQDVVDALEARARASGVGSVSGLRALWEAEQRPLRSLDALAAAARRGPAALLARAGTELDALFSAAWRRRAPVLGADDAIDAVAVGAARRTLEEMRACARATRDLGLDLATLGQTLAELELVTGERPGPAAVAVVDPLELRARRVRALFLCGLQEGIIPAPVGPAPFLDDEDRRELARAAGVQLVSANDAGAERYLLYACVSRPEELLVLSWHCADDDGAPAAPSSFLDDVRVLFHEELWAERRRRPLGAVGWPGPGDPPTAAAALAPAPPAERRYEPPIAPLRDPRVLAALADAPWSASGLETWVACPVKWFVQRLLRADDLDPDPEPLTRGSIAHDVLETTHRRLAERTGSGARDPRPARAGLGPHARGARRAPRRADPVHSPRARSGRSPAPRGRPRPLPRARVECRQPVGAGLPRAVVRLRGRRASGVRARRRRARARAHRSGRRLGRGRGDPLRLQGTRRPRALALGQRRPRADRRLHARGAAVARAARRRRVLPADGRSRAASARRARRRPRAPTGHRQRRPARSRGGGCARRRRARRGPRGGHAGACRPSRGPTELVRVRRRLRVPGDLPMRALTADQERAAARRRGSLLLAAGAGSGKTSVLVERFVRAVHEDGIPPRRILAITFTERAAAELRERVRGRLRDLGDRELARDSERAPIGTVHAFCARIVRAHAAELGLDPRFGVLDEARATDLRERAFAGALDAFQRSRGAPAVDLTAAYSADRLQESIVAAYDALRTRGERSPRLPVPRPALTADVAAAARRLTAAARSAREEILAAAGGAPVAAATERALAALQRADELALVGDPPLPGACAAAALPARNGSLAGAACETYRAAQEAYAQACADHHALAAVDLLGELLERYDTAYARAKRELGMLDFDDLEIEASRLLDGDRALRGVWSERFELVMIDEFQDTNPRQMRILAALERDNLFTVGDEFQSIYGFRHADVGLFRTRRAELAAREATLELAHNFRGRPQLLEAVNAVFAPLFGPTFTPLVAGREHPGAASDAAEEPIVELLITDQRGWEDPRVDPAGALPTAARWRQAEARLLAQRIADLLRDGVAPPGEFAVLLRATGDVPVFARALEDAGVSTLIADGGGYWSAPEVLDCLAYLHTLANPLDDVALYGTLGSPLVGVSADALALIARARGSSRAWTGLTRLFGASPGERDDELEATRRSFADADADACRAFLAFVRPERRLAARRPIDVLVRRALAETGYDGHLLGLPFPERRLANVHKLLRLAREYERGEGGGLRGFLEQAERRRAGAVREGDAPVADADSDAVRVMTIHAAKGLEFDVVAIADLGRQGRADPPDLLVDGDRVGLRLASLDSAPGVPALAFASLRDERLAAEAEEERRILYVAMTRARERLLLSGAVNPERWPQPRPGAPALGWLGPGVAEDLPDALSVDEPVTVLHPPAAPHVAVRCRYNAPGTVGTVLRAVAPAGQPAPASARASERLLAAERSTGGAEAPPAPGAGPDALSYTALAEFERCGYRYYLERVLGLPPDERLPATLRHTDRDEGLPARVRGSLVHRLLETLDFRAPRTPADEAVMALAAELGVRPTLREVDEIARLVVAVADTELGARLASAPRTRREHRFAFSLGADRPLLTGIVDLIAHEMGGGALIVDYKSDRVGDADLAALTEREYGIQRRVYALAALRGGALEVDVVHWYLQRPAEPVSVRYAARDDERLTGELCERVAAVTEGLYPVSERPGRDLCLSCPGRRALCRYPPSVTLAPTPGGQTGATRT